MTDEKSLLVKFLEDYVERTGASEDPEQLRDDIMSGERNLGQIAEAYAKSKEA